MLRTNTSHRFVPRWTRWLIVVLVIMGTTQSQGLPELLSALDLTYAQKVDCTAGMIERRYVYCAEYPYGMDVMRIDVPQSLVLKGFQNLEVVRDQVQIATDEGTITVRMLPGFLLVLMEEPRSSSLVMYVVDVAVEPEGLRPVSLVVVRSPPNSRWEPGMALGSVPGRVVLDVAGEWILQGDSGGNMSPAVALELPDQQQITLKFP